MKMKLFFRSPAAALAVLIASALPLHAASDAETLVTLQASGPAMASAVALFQPVLDKARKDGIPPAGIKEISDAAAAFFKKSLENPDFKKELAQTYEDNFTPEELHALVEFYGTPAGKKLMTLQPQLSEQGAQLSRKYATKNQDAFKEELRSIFERYHKSQPKTESAAAPEKPADGDKK